MLFRSAELVKKIEAVLEEVPGSTYEYVQPIEDRFNEPGAGDRLNDEGVERFLDTSAEDVRARFDDLHRRVVAEIEATSDETWTAAYPYYPDDDTLGERIGSLLGSDDGRFTHASAHLPDLRAYVDATRR